MRLGFGVDAIERLHEHLDGLADLIAELVGDFLLVLCALGVKSGKRLGFCNAQESAQVQQAVKRPECDRLLHPEVGIPRGEAGGLAAGRIDEHPVLAVCDQAERHIRRVEQLHHPRGW